MDSKSRSLNRFILICLLIASFLIVVPIASAAGGDNLKVNLQNFYPGNTTGDIHNDTNGTLDGGALAGVGGGRAFQGKAFSFDGSGDHFNLTGVNVSVYTSWSVGFYMNRTAGNGDFDGIFSTHTTDSSAGLHYMWSEGDSLGHFLRACDSGGGIHLQ